MTSRRFFGWVWRVNSLMILAASVLAVVLLGVFIASQLRDWFRTRQTTDVVNLVEEQVQGTRSRLGRFEQIAGTGVLRASLNVEQAYELGTISKESTSVQNYLYFEPRTQQSYWLLPGYRGLVLEDHLYPDPTYGDTSTPVVTTLFQLIDADSNGDGKLSYSDRLALAVSDPIGKQLVRVVKDVERFNGAYLMDAQTLVVLYSTRGEVRAAEVGLNPVRLLRDSEVRPAAATGVVP